MAQWTADRRLYLDMNGNVVEANDPAKRLLLVPAGGNISLDRATALGLVTTDAKAKAPVSNKARKAPANKARE